MSHNLTRLFRTALTAADLTASANHFPVGSTRETPPAGISWQLFFAYNDAKAFPVVNILTRFVGADGCSFLERPVARGFGLALLVARPRGWFQKFFALGLFF
jgi:hypothetical protein